MTTTYQRPLDNTFHPDQYLVPRNMLRVAVSLMANWAKAGLTKKDWDATPAPVAPVGHVTFEQLRMAMTFLLPVLVLVAGGVLSAKFNTHTAFLLSVPAALFAGWANDALLQRATRKAVIKAGLKDKGRFVAVQYLARNMGVTPAEVTWALMSKMAADAVVVTKLLMAQKAKDDAALKAERAKQAKSRKNRGTGYEERRAALLVGQVATAGAAASTAYAVEEASPFDTDSVYNTPLFDEVDLFPMVNTNGLPMIGNTGIDVAGNVYGTPVDFGNDF